MRMFTCAVAALAMAALLLPAPAAAQTVVYDYDDHGAWWDSFDCPAMKRLLPAHADGTRGRTGAEGDDAHEDRVCVMTANLNLEDSIIVRDFISRTMTDAHATHKAWWNAQSPASNACTYWQQALAGQAPIATDGGVIIATLTADNSATTTPGILTSGMTQDYCGSYDRLNDAGHARADKSGDALSGRGDMTPTPTPTPAVPFVFLMLLGGGLAARGAWMRRRRS